MDSVDKKLLRILQRDGRITNVDLATQSGMSESPCLRRTRGLEEAGIIKGYRAALDPKKAGFPVSAYCLVNLSQHGDEAARHFHDAIRNQAHVIECALVSGSYDYLLKIVAPGIDELADITLKDLLSLPHVRDVSTLVVFRDIKPFEGLPV